MQINNGKAIQLLALCYTLMHIDIHVYVLTLYNVHSLYFLSVIVAYFLNAIFLKKLETTKKVKLEKLINIAMISLALKSFYIQ